MINSNPSRINLELYIKLEKAGWKVQQISKDDFTAIKAGAPDLLVTFNLEGFQNSTLTDCVSYNLLDCKQVHVILNDNLPNERFLQKQLSISMFFYCTVKRYYEQLKNAYHDIPYLKLLEGWQRGTEESAWKHNAALLAAAVEDVARVCGLS